MQPAADFLARPLQPQQSPDTEAATFTITAADVGTRAVRPGCMADLEQQRDVLLIAARVALKRVCDDNGDQVTALMLRAAIALARAL